MQRALILVDFENEWINPDSDYFVGDISEMLDKTNALLALCRGNKDKIIWIRHVEKDSDEAFAEDSDNTAMISSLQKEQNDIVITKYKISPFYKTTLEQELQGIDEIIVCGILSNLCVRSTIQDAYDRDFGIKVITDCCVAMDEQTQGFTWKDLKNTREEIEFVELENFMKG